MAQRAHDTVRSDKFLIIELFAKRRPYYGHADVLRLTRSSDDEIAAAVEAGDLEPYREGGMLRFAWDDVARFALRRWTPRMICAVLGDAHAAAVPFLNRVKPIQVQLPLYQIRLLHVLSDAEGEGFRGRLNVSDILERHLLDLVSSVDAEEMEEAIPGFRAAVQYPYFTEREDSESTAYCRFCGRLCDQRGRETCDDCIDRHEPPMHSGGVPELDEES